MRVETKVYHLLTDLGYSTGKTVDLQRVFNDLFKKGLIEGAEYVALQQRIRKFDGGEEQLEVG